MKNPRKIRMFSAVKHFLYAGQLLEFFVSFGNQVCFSVLNGMIVLLEELVRMCDAFQIKVIVNSCNVD